MFYVYEWFIKETNEVIYVGKGKGKRYKVRKHNRLFDEMIKRFECESRIIKYFENEEDAFKYEYERIEYMKSVNQCVCNINKGGSGGTISWWDDETRKKYSEQNIMKTLSQRKRMSENNPMKNPQIMKEVARKKMRAVVINGETYESCKSAAEQIGVCDYTIITWCKRGYDTNGNPCRYKDETQKEYPSIKKTHPKATTPKPVIVNGVRYETVKEGASSIGVCSETLIRAIKSNKKCKGFECRYDNQQPSHKNTSESIVEGSTTNK